MSSRIIAFVLEKTATAEDRIMINIALDIVGVIILHYYQSNVRFEKVWCDVQPNMQLIAFELEEQLDSQEFMAFIDAEDLDDYAGIMEYKRKKLALEIGGVADKFETLMVEIAKSDLEGVPFETCEAAVQQLGCEKILDYVRTIIKKENMIIE